MDRVVDFDLYSEPMKALIDGFVAAPGRPTSFRRRTHGWWTARRRRIRGTCSARPTSPTTRYLPGRNRHAPRPRHSRRPAVFPGQRGAGGPPEQPADARAGIPPLAVYNPIHYQEVPELFMDFICSLTGKSPSTTGFGSEGALTKGPFNALLPVVDVNNALVSAVVTGYGGFTTSAGYIGPKYRVDHDNSMLDAGDLVPHAAYEREPPFLIENGYLEPVRDFEYEGRPVLASRLGYRITPRSSIASSAESSRCPTRYSPTSCCGRNSRTPARSLPAWTASWTRSGASRSTTSTTAASSRRARRCGRCCTSWRTATTRARGSGTPAVRAMFTREAVLSSDWYRERLRAKQRRDVALWTRHTAALDTFRPGGSNAWFPQHLNLEERHRIAREQLERVSAPAYLKELEGTIGADPFC